MMRAARMYTDAMIKQQPDIRVREREEKMTLVDVVGGFAGLALAFGFFFYVLPALVR